MYFSIFTGLPKLLLYSYYGLVRKQSRVSKAVMYQVDSSSIYEIFIELIPVTTMTIHYLFFQFGPHVSQGGNLYTNSLEADNDNLYIWISIAVSLINLCFGITGWAHSRIEIIRNKYVFLIEKKQIMREIEGQQVTVYEDNFDFFTQYDGIYYLCMVLTFMMQISITARYKSYILFREEYILSYDVGLLGLSVNLIFVILYFMIKLDGINTQEFKNINSEIIKLEGN